MSTAEMQKQTVGLADMANAIRALSMDAVQKANSGHPGMPMGAADVATVLFARHLKFDAAEPDWPDRDRFVLSAGHGSMLLYSLLHLTGYPGMDIDQLKNFRQFGSMTAGHPEYGHAAGIEVTTGPLGQGVATAVGMALAERMMAARHGDGIVDHYTYALAGDGCLMEGISHEAISLAGHLKLAKLIVLFDDNGITIDGKTDISVGDDQLARFQASGWDVASVDGHDANAIDAAIAAARKSDAPSLIACKTVIGFGAPTKAGTSATHGAPLGDEEIAGAREKLGWPYPPFEVPADILDAWRTAGARGASERSAWEGRFADLDTDKRNAFERTTNGDLPLGWETALDDFKKRMSEESPKLATRISSQKVLELLTAAVPEMVGGSADLTGSNGTKVAGMRAVEAGDFSGSYINYGVREHGLIPYGGTFLVFADYCRPAIRLSALMGIRVVYVMTHDSIGLGEDGPTHQPVEHLASLRAMPNLNVFRPADIVETAECWALALHNDKTPSVMALTRQNLPTLRTEHSIENRSAKGAYVLAEASGGADARKVTLLATGSEVEIAIAARNTLEAEGTPTAVVSVPCFELFAAQDEAYRKSVLGPKTVRVGIEAAVRQGWDALIRNHGGFVGMDSFGASAPIGQLYEHFGITANAVVAEAKKRL
jgi:transketolase